jgi:hypothetical protein
MRKLFAIVLVGALGLGVSPARADGPPAANVSCSLTDAGVRYGVSMVFTGSGISFNSLKYEWEYLVAGKDKDPTLVSSYGPRTLQSVTAGNGLDLSYEALLALAKDDEKASVLMYASSVFSDGLSVLTNRTGSGCYVELPVVFKNRNEKSEAAIAKAATDAAAASAKAIEEANAEIKAIEDKANKAATKKSVGATSITCVKGKVIKKVKGVSPKCPAGFKKK